MTRNGHTDPGGAEDVVETPTAARFFDPEEDTAHSTRVTRSKTASKRKRESHLPQPDRGGDTIQVLGSDGTLVTNVGAREALSNRVARISLEDRTAKRRKASAVAADVDNDEDDAEEKVTKAKRGIKRKATAGVDGMEADDQQLLDETHDNEAEASNGRITRSMTALKKQRTSRGAVTTKSRSTRKTPSKSKTQVSSNTMPRRSSRIRKLYQIIPKSFERSFPNLPPELQKTVWEFAAGQPSLARCVYLRNPSCRDPTRTYIAGVRNRLPELFSVDIESRRAIYPHYKLMFPRKLAQADLPNIVPAAVDTSVPELFLRGPPAAFEDDEATGGDDANTTSVPMATGYDWTHAQLVNPETDVVVFEPCCSGCRAYGCSRLCFSPEDLAAVKYLAVHSEPAWVRNNPWNIWACYKSVSTAWPNVEVLYLIMNSHSIDWAAPGLVDWALIKLDKYQPSSHEGLLLADFENWKKGAGKDKVLREMVYVQCVPRTKPRPGQSPGTQYNWATRMLGPTGTVKDVIIG